MAVKHVRFAYAVVLFGAKLKREDKLKEDITLLMKADVRKIFVHTF